MMSVPDSIQAWLLLCPELKPLFDPSSTDEDFDTALEIHIAEAVKWLEDNANYLHPDSEDSLSTTLAGHLSIKKLIDAKREGNTNGHVDITITVLSSSRKRLGEAKIYNGYVYHSTGMQQLIQRYSTGRERTGYMFSYVKKPKIKEKIKELRDECNVYKPCNQLNDATDHKMKWAFETIHSHGSCEQLRVVHVGVNLHIG